MATIRWSRSPKGPGLSGNIPLFYGYTFLNSFYLDRGIWMLFLLAQGFSLTEIGLLESLYHVASFVFEVPTGYVADRFGKKASLLCGQALKIISALLLVFGGGNLMLYIGFMLGAVAGTFLSGATGALIYETMKETGRESGFKRLNSRLYAVTLVSMGFASPAGGALAQIRWDLLYLCAALLAGLALAIVLLLKEPVHAGAGESASAGGRADVGTGAGADTSASTGAHAGAGAGADASASMEDSGVPDAPAGFIEQLRLSADVLRRHKGLRALIVYGAPLYAVTTSVSFYVQLLLENNGMAKPLIGTFNGLDTWLGAAAGAAAYGTERLLRRSGLLTVCSIGSIAAVLALGLAGGSSAAVLAAFFAMNGLMSLLEPMLEAYLNEYLPSAQRATLLSFFSMMVSVSMVVSFFSVSWLADLAGIKAALLALGAVWAPVQLWFTIRAVRLSPRSPPPIPRPTASPAPRENGE